jgi:nitrogen fixation NifU-like protein
MDAALSELYQDIILEHNRNPRHREVLPSPNGVARGNNPSCGDDITVFVAVCDGIVERITFAGDGCAISKASASLMTELLTGKPIDEAEKIIGEVCALLNSDAQGANPLERYGEVAALAGVKKFPMRVKCATLAWHAAGDALVEASKP